MTAKVLTYDFALGCYLWVNYDNDSVSVCELVESMRKGLQRGDWIAWSLIEQRVTHEPKTS